MISVIIPAYNSSDTIVECIKSVLNQSRVDLIEEIIVVDDGSTDNTGILVSKLKKNNPKVILIKKENRGVSSARNTGIMESRSEWIAFLDSDDIWKKDKIKIQWELIKKRRDIFFVGCNRENENIHWGRKEEDSLYSLDLFHVLIKNWPHTSTALIKKNVFVEVGMYNEKMKYAEDGDLWNRIVLRHPLLYITEPLVITGGNKLSFGERGLSANIREMHNGNVRNIKILANDGDISLLFYLFLRIFYYAKYIRRVIITFIHKKGIHKKDDKNNDKK